MCHHPHVGIIVDCYHDWCPMDLEPACADCGARASRTPEYDYERPSYFMKAQSLAHIERVMRSYRAGDGASDALDFLWDK